MNTPRRVLVFAGYTKAAEHRKIELLADAEEFEIVHVAGAECGRGRAAIHRRTVVAATRCASARRSAGAAIRIARLAGRPAMAWAVSGRT